MIKPAPATERPLTTPLATLQVFADMDEDQFDFHGYCLRKFTMRAYLGSVPPNRPRLAAMCAS